MNRKCLAATTIILAGAVVTADYVMEFLQIDACLDHGGAFNYVTMECSTDPNGPPTFPFVSYPSRNRAFLAIVGAVAFLFAATLLRGDRRISAAGSGTTDDE